MYLVVYGLCNAGRTDRIAELLNLFAQSGAWPNSLEQEGDSSQGRACRGRQIVKTQPMPGTSRTVKVPKSDSTLWRAMERPRPRPDLS